MQDVEMMLPAHCMMLPVLQEHQEQAATLKLQRLCRSKLARAHGRQLRAMWPSIEQLRAKYIDDSVQQQLQGMRPGRAATFYSDEMLIKREVLRTHPAVVQAIDDAWLACSAIGTGAQQGGEAIDHANYRALAKRVYLVTVLASGRDPLVSEYNEAVQRDWIDDTGPNATMSRAAFFNSMFELADLHTRSVQPQAYAKWVRGITSRIVKRGEDADGGKQLRWRDCSSIAASFNRSGRRSSSSSETSSPSRRSSSSSGSGNPSAAASTPNLRSKKPSWHLQHWLSAFTAEGEQEVLNGAAAPACASRRVRGAKRPPPKLSPLGEDAKRTPVGEARVLSGSSSLTTLRRRIPPHVAPLPTRPPKPTAPPLAELARGASPPRRLLGAHRATSWVPTAAPPPLLTKRESSGISKERVRRRWRAAGEGVRDLLQRSAPRFTRRSSGSSGSSVGQSTPRFTRRSSGSFVGQSTDEEVGGACKARAGLCRNLRDIIAEAKFLEGTAGTELHLPLPLVPVGAARI